MTHEQITALVEKQRGYFSSGLTLPAAVRVDALRKLRQALSENEGRIADALHSDLGKSPQEGYMCETGMALSELSYLIRHTPSFARKKAVPTPLAQFAARSYRKPSPYGVTLIMSPWNYPLLLTIGPLADALAAGNTAIVKPSAYSPATSSLLAELLGNLFPPEYVAVVTGGRAENNHLLEQKFDYIFFTGSTGVGRLVLEKAAKHLTPVTLELGGKSPCIVDESANLKLAARRIVFGKFLNSGQTCVAPDYILCHCGVKEELLAHIQAEISRQYGDGNCGKIVNPKHFERLTGLLQPEKVVIGGTCDPDAPRISPTVMDNVNFDDPVMQEEIFGPILPILTYTDLESVIETVNRRPKPLALYLFSENKKSVETVTSRCSFGGGCVNDVIIHLATTHMPFGGVGESGMGAYHGKAGFDTFTHYKSIVDKKTWLDLPMRYRPYTKLSGKLVRLFLK